MSKKVKILNPTNLPLIDYRELNDLQGKLKKFSPEDEAKFLRIIMQRGFKYPFLIWFDKNKQPWTIDGNGRNKLFRKHDITDEYGSYNFPYVEISAKNKQEAAEEILAFSSDFHKKDKEGFEFFISDHGIDQDWVKDMTAFADSFYLSTDEEEYDHNQSNGENSYSRKIQAPTYEPREEKPESKELYDISKTKQLIEDIESSAVEPEIKQFLKLAAQRHCVFNYEKIADFYAHSSKEVQELMEQSALVIIDFDKAIELGYVRLSEEVAQQYLEEHVDAV